MAPVANAMTVAVIIPAYRAARTIARCLDSLRAQTIRPDHVIIVDDGSPDRDELLHALEPYRDGVTLIHQDNGGASRARNTGIDAAVALDADLIAFLDADDYWLPTKLELQLDVLRQHPEVGLVACTYRLVTPEGELLPAELVTTAPWVTGPPARYAGRRAFDFAGEIATSAILVRREALGSERFQLGLQTAEDRDLWVRVARRTTVSCRPEPLVCCVQEPDSLSRTDPDRDYPNMLWVINRHAGMLGRRAVSALRAQTYRSWAAANLGRGRPRAARRPALNRLRHDPFSAEGWWVLLKSLVGTWTPADEPRFRPATAPERSRGPVLALESDRHSWC